MSLLCLIIFPLFVFMDDDEKQGREKEIMRSK
jgi:hypothetical protein